MVCTTMAGLSINTMFFSLWCSVPILVPEGTDFRFNQSCQNKLHPTLPETSLRCCDLLTKDFGLKPPQYLYMPYEVFGGVNINSTKLKVSVSKYFLSENLKRLDFSMSTLCSIATLLGVTIQIYLSSILETFQPFKNFLERILLSY